MKETALRLIFYVGGFFTAAAGITTILRSDLGAGAWDTVTNNLSVLADITLGMASMSINLTIMVLIILYRKRPRFLFMVVPILMIGAFIDLWDLVIYGDYVPEGLGLRLLFYLLGTGLLTFGLSLSIVSGYPAMVFDELTLMIMDVFNSESFFKSRLAIELFAIVLASGLGFLAEIGFGAVNFGSFILALILPPIMGRELEGLRRHLPFEDRRT